MTNSHPLNRTTPQMRRLLAGATQVWVPCKLDIPADQEEVFTWFIGDLRESTCGPFAAEGLYVRSPLGLQWLGPCPLGVPGDVVWARWPHWHKPASDLCPERIWDEETGILRSRDHGGVYEDRTATLQQTMDVGGFRRRRAASMPLWASRWKGEVVGVRVARVQSVTEADCAACGIPTHFQGSAIGGLRHEFAAAWNTDHGPGAWERSDWCWVVDVRRLES